MKMIFKVTKTELRNLFYSPVAWFLLIAFLVQCAVFYTNMIYGIAKYQDMMIRNNPNFKDFSPLTFTSTIFLDSDGIFKNALQNLFLYVPLLTMGLISREINNGTIKLLYSSPVKVREIVLGKYLAIMLYNLLLVLILGIFMVTGAFNIRAVDYGMLLSAALGFYLLLCAFTAIGLFMSSLSTYQIVSAIGSFILIFCLGRVGELWQKYEFVRDLTYFLSMTGRTGKMLIGLITTKDVIYYIVIVYMFLGFTLLKLKGGQESRPWYVKARRYVLVIASALLVGYISSRPAVTGYWDTTAGKSNTIHKRTQQLIRDLGKDSLEVTLYSNLLGGGVFYGLPEQRNNYLTWMWEKYVRFRPDIRFKYVDYYDYDPVMDDSAMNKFFPGKTIQQMARETAKLQDVKLSRYKSPEEIRSIIDLKPEHLRMVMQLKYKGKTTFLRTFDDATFWPNEELVAAGLKRLLQPQVPKVLYVTGNLERNIHKKGEREYRIHTIDKSSRLSLINLGFDVDTISLDTHDIPSDITELVLADPKTELSAVTLGKIRRYIEGGGNMLICGEPGKQEILNPLLQQLGIQLMPGILVQPTKDEMPHIVAPYFTKTGLDLAEEFMLLSAKTTGDTLGWFMPGVAALSGTSTSPFTMKPLLMTEGQKTWVKMGRLVTDSAEVVYNPQEGDIKGSFTTAMALTREVRGKEQRIIVCGDADYMSNLRSGGDYTARAMYSWLDENKFPIYLPHPKLMDNKLFITEAGAEVLKIAYVWVLPSLVFLMGTILLIRRKRK